MPYTSLHDPARAGFHLTATAFAALVLLAPPRTWGPR